MFWPTKRTSLEQWEVIVWGVIIFFVLVGGVGLYISSRVPANKLDAAAHIRFVSFSSWGVAAVLYAGKRVIVYLND